MTKIVYNACFGGFGLSEAGLMRYAELKGLTLYPEKNEGKLDKEAQYRNALLWAFDRLSIDGGMTEREQATTMREIGNVLTGKPSAAGEYVPVEWAGSAKFKTATR